MKYILNSLVIAWLLTSCSSVEPDIEHVDLVITINNSEGTNIVENANYDVTRFRYINTINSAPLENFMGCPQLFLIPLGGPDPWLIDYGNGDVDTITYKWDSEGNATFPEIMKLDWIEIYYNKGLVKRMEFNNNNERQNLIDSNCSIPSCPTDCNSPDVIEIIKD